MPSMTLRGALLFLVILFVGCSSQPNGTDQISGSGVIGGRGVTEQDKLAQSVVAVFNPTVNALCTGTLISESHILTAAHCIRDELDKMQVFFKTDLVKDRSDSRRVLAVSICPEYKFGEDVLHDACDIAVLKFEGGLPPGYVVAKPLADPLKLASGTPLTVLGFGMDNPEEFTGEGYLRIVSTALDDPAYSRSEFTIDQRNGQGACHGDSGGPLFYRDGQENYVAGVVIMGLNDRRRRCNKWMIATSVSYYITFISQALAEL